MIAVPGWKSASYLPNCSGGIKLLIVCLPVCLSVCLFVCLPVRYCWSDCGTVVCVCYSEVGGSMGGHLWSFKGSHSISERWRSGGSNR